MAYIKLGGLTRVSTGLKPCAIAPPTQSFSMRHS